MAQFGIGVDGESFPQPNPSIKLHLSTTSSLNFSAPTSVPGSSQQIVTLTGAAVGDEVTCSAPFASAANFILSGYVSAANTVTLRWTQISGSPADPDGTGATYRVSSWRH